VSKQGFLSDNEIVDDIVRCIEGDPKSLSDWLTCPFEDLIMLHHGTGTHIRNYYKMWAEENPFSNIDPPANTAGIVDHPDFPDQRSQRCIERVWQMIHRKHGIGPGTKKEPIDVAEFVKQFDDEKVSISNS
jgi:hypothetical protein